MLQLQQPNGSNANQLLMPRIAEKQVLAQLATADDEKCCIQVNQ